MLYVEDEESDAMFMQRAFDGKGLAGRLQLRWQVRRAGGIPSAFTGLLDLNLPQVGGFEVLKWMRNNPDHARTPVVVFSSSTREDDRLTAKELGADEFVAKPSSGLAFGEVVKGLHSQALGVQVTHGCFQVR